MKAIFEKLKIPIMIFKDWKRKRLVETRIGNRGYLLWYLYNSPVNLKNWKKKKKEKSFKRVDMVRSD